MPIYEYYCGHCGRVGEFFAGIGNGVAELECKHCGSKELRKNDLVRFCCQW